MSSDPSARVSVRQGEAVRNGRCQACTVDSCPPEVWVILLGDPEGPRTEVRLCSAHLREIVGRAEALSLESFSTWVKANSGRSQGG